MDHTQKVQVELVCGTHGSCSDANLGLNGAARRMLDNQCAIPEVAAEGQAKPSYRISELVSGLDKLVTTDIFESLLDVPKDGGLAIVAVLETPAKEQPVHTIVLVMPLGHVDSDVPAPGLCPMSQPVRAAPGMQPKNGREQIHGSMPTIHLRD
jgi:hypothetical protein